MSGIAKVLRGLSVSAQLDTQTEDTGEVRVEFDLRDSDGCLTIAGRRFTLNLRLSGIERG